MIQLLKMAFRNLGRNRRRSFFSSLALGMGLALLLLIASFLQGEMGGAMNTAIRLQSGHLQVRANTYDSSKESLKWEDLIENPDQVAAKIAALAPVKAATPRLYATGIVSVGEVTTGVNITGIDPASVANDPYREGMVSGNFLTADDLTGILVGLPLAEKLGLSVGDTVSLSANTSNGDVSEQNFTVRGIYSTNTNGFDSFTVFLPLAKAQSLTQTGNHASTIFVLLKDMAQTDAVANALKSSSYQVLTYTKLNDVIIQTENMANSYLSIIYLIVLAITSSVIVNTLLMAVFERTREIGILSAIGMKSSRILALFLAESTLLAVGGILMGLVLGVAVIAYLSKVGFFIGKMGLTGILIGNTVYPDLTMQDAVTLTIIAFIITLLAGLIPAVMASRMEPVKALHSGD
jgi:ABC-type lipoprotein release transport system permease subunit